MAVNPSEVDRTRLHPVLRSPERNEEFLTNGFVTVPFLSDDELDRLRAALSDEALFGESGFFDTAAGLGAEARRPIHGLLTEAFAERADALLHDYVAVMSSFITKWPGDDSQKEVHRDFRLVDEHRFRTVTVWVPLVDVDDTNGALSILPGSHLVDTGPRSVPTTPRSPQDPLPDLAFDELVTVPMRAGDAAVFDMAVAHGSPPNRSTRQRTAIAVAYAPTEAALSLYFCHPDDRVEELEVTDPELFRHIDWRVPPTGLRSLGFVPTDRRAVSAAELVRRSRVVVGRRSSAGPGQRHQGGLRRAAGRLFGRPAPLAGPETE